MSARPIPALPPGVSLKRAPALVSLSRDHHAALVQALALRRSASASPATRLRTGRRFLAFVERELLGHFADEEQVLLPQAAGVDDEGAARLRSEHAELRALIARLRAAVEQRQVAAELCGALGDLLHDHVRFEERSYFMRVQAGLAPDALEALGQALEAQRLARGVGAACARSSS